MLLIADNHLLGICCSIKESFERKLVLKLIPLLYPNLKLLQLKLNTQINISNSVMS